MEAQRERARAARGDNTYLDEKSEKYHEAIGDLITEFVGYDELADSAEVVAILGADGTSLDKLSEAEQGEVVISRTPFYAASGGQQADTGMIVSSRGAAARVASVSRPFGEVISHKVKMAKGTLKRGRQSYGIRRRRPQNCHHAKSYGYAPAPCGSQASSRRPRAAGRLLCRQRTASVRLFPL